MLYKPFQKNFFKASIGTSIHLKAQLHLLFELFFHPSLIVSLLSSVSNVST